jgi:hypothetical protein
MRMKMSMKTGIVVVAFLAFTVWVAGQTPVQTVAGGTLLTRRYDFDFLFSVGVPHPFGFGFGKGGAFSSSLFWRVGDP